MSRAVWQTGVRILAYNSQGPGFHPQYHTYTRHKKEGGFIYCTDSKDFNSNHARREDPLFNRHKERCIQSIDVNLGSFFNYMIVLESMAFKSFGWQDKVEY